MIIRARVKTEFGSAEANVLGVMKYGMVVAKHVLGTDLIAMKLWSVYDLETGYIINRKPFRKVKSANAFRKELHSAFCDFTEISRNEINKILLPPEDIRLIYIIEKAIHDNEQS